MIAPLPSGPFTTIVADPPWRYRDKLRMGVKKDGTPHKGHRGAESHYPCMSLDEIKSIPVSDIAADNAHLYLWTTNAFVVEAHAISYAWGFRVRTMITWVKPQMGMGHYFRGSTEHVLFGVRGRLSSLRHNAKTYFTADRTKHSKKPDVFYRLVESMSPGPYIELFSRERRLGWSSWGNEV